MAQTTKLVPVEITPATATMLADDLRDTYPLPWTVVQRTNGNVIVQAANGQGIVPLGRFDVRIALLIAYAANSNSAPVTVDTGPET